MEERNLAYDLSIYEPKPEREKRQEQQEDRALRVVSNPKAKSGQKRAPIKVVMAMLAIVVTVSLMIYNRAVLTELGDSINQQTSRLKNLASEEVRLKSEIEANTSVRKVEEIAVEELHMSKIDKSQITYVALSEEDKIEVSESAGGLLERLSRFLSGIVEYIRG